MYNEVHESFTGMSYKLRGITYRPCHEKTSYVSNYAFFTLLHE